MGDTLIAGEEVPVEGINGSAASPREKSPSRSAAVSTIAELIGFWRIVVLWYEKKAKALFLLIGPPSVPPNWLRFSPSCLVEK